MQCFQNKQATTITCTHYMVTICILEMGLHLQQQCFQNKQVFKTWTGRNYFLHSHTQCPSAKVTKLQHNFEGLAKTKAQACFVQLGFSTSNQQKVQLNTDLLKHKTRYLYI
jgi:hypothetical protein